MFRVTNGNDKYCFLKMQAGIVDMRLNGWRYEIVGDCGLLSCPFTPNLMRGRILYNHLKPQCFIPRVVHWRSFPSELFSFKFAALSCLLCVGADILFGKFWIAGWLCVTCQCVWMRRVGLFIQIVFQVFNLFCRFFQFRSI
jgi:hypothetical protein